MKKVLRDYDQEMIYCLLSTADRDGGIFRKGNADVFLRSDIETRYRAYQTGINGGFLQIAEARKKEDLPFVPGTDRLIIGNGASIPLEDLGKQYVKGGEKSE